MPTQILVRAGTLNCRGPQTPSRTLLETEPRRISSSAPEEKIRLYDRGVEYD